MRSKLAPIDNFLVCHVAILLRLAGLVAVLSGLIGGFNWLLALLDRQDGDALRWGFYHNPFMQFPPFDETFLDLSLYILWVCSAAVGLGGLMLLVPWKWGIPLVTWQARISIITNSVISFFVIAILLILPKNQWGEWTLDGTPASLALRLGSIAVDLMLWAFLSSNLVQEFFVRQSHPPERAFSVIIKQPRQSG